MKATRFRKKSKFNKNVIVIPIAALSAFTVALISFASYVSHKEKVSIMYAEAATLDMSMYETASSNDQEVSEITNESSDLLEDTVLLDGRVDAEPEEESYTVTWFESAIPLYTNNNVNLRLGPDTSYEVVSVLQYGTQVVATGSTDNGWYAIDYDGQTLFVTDAYIQDTEPEPLVTAVETASSTSDIVFVGDSRTVGMEYAVGGSDYTWLCEVGKGYYWLKENIDSVDDNATAGTIIIINLGVNDLGNASKYVDLINSYIDTWTSEGLEVYYSAVTPVGDTTVTNDQIEKFNQTLKAGLDSRITWIDSYSYLTDNGFSSSDGLHYNNATYKSLFNYYISVIE